MVGRKLWYEAKRSKECLINFLHPGGRDGFSTKIGPGTIRASKAAGIEKRKKEEKAKGLGKGPRGNEGGVLIQPPPRWRGRRGLGIAPL